MLSVCMWGCVGLSLNFRGSRGEQSGIRRPQAGRQPPALFQPSYGWWLPWRGEPVAVSKAVLVVATWRELLSRQAGGH